MLTSALARHLADHGHGTYDTAGATIRLEELPPDGDGTSVSFKPSPTAEVGGYDLVGVQVVVRRAGAGRARVGWEAAQAIRDALDGLRDVTLAPSTIDEQRLVWMLSDDSGPLNIGDDPNGLPRWSLRFNALIPHATPLTVGI